VEDERLAALRDPPNTGAAAAEVARPRIVPPVAAATPPAISIRKSSRRVAPRRMAFSIMASSAMVQFVTLLLVMFSLWLIATLDAGALRAGSVRVLTTCRGDEVDRRTDHVKGRLSADFRRLHQRGTPPCIPAISSYTVTSAGLLGHSGKIDHDGFSESVKRVVPRPGVR